jgi:bisphosphoglycerate-independent phosphoglycerate mutase (AlkP superfamily)
METAEATRRIKLLEERYFELNRDLQAMRVQLACDPVDVRPQGLSEARLAQREREMRTILQQIAHVEDSLLD